MSQPRIKSIEPPYTDQLQESFNVVMPPGMPPLNIFRTVGNNERVLSRMVRGGLLDRGSDSFLQLVSSGSISVETLLCSQLLLLIILVIKELAEIMAGCLRHTELLELSGRS